MFGIKVGNYMGGSPEAVGIEDPEIDPGSERRGRVVSAQEHGWRLDKVLTQIAPEFSRNHLQGLIAAGHVRLDGQVAGPASRKVRVGQALALELVPPAESRAFIAQAMDLDIVFEDEHLLVVNKPAGLVVHPAAGNWSGTLLNGLLARDPQAAQLPRAGIVHRLDKDTSGLMVVGRSLLAVTALVRDIAARTVRRRYLALVHGNVGESPFTVEAPIGRDPATRVRMAVVAGGKPARTDVTPLGHRDGVSAVRCALHTGRTHQIRVHLAQEGHPLVGDVLYGGRALLGMARQALHAHELGFEHPITGASLLFSRPPPADLASAWSRVVPE